MSDAMLVELKQCFMEAYDDNQDGKIDIREVSPSRSEYLRLVLQYSRDATITTALPPLQWPAARPASNASIGEPDD